MARFVLGRLALIPPTLVLLALVTFFLGYLSPSDPVEIMLGQHANPQAAERLRHDYGLDRPPLVQFGAYALGALRGDLGRSYYDQKPVAQILVEGFPATLALGLCATVVAVLIGVPLGVLAAARQDTWLDRASMSLALVGISVPAFVIGPLLIYVVSTRLRLLPVAQWGTARDLLLPALTLGSRPAALIARLTRASMLDALRQDYIRTAFAKGLAAPRVILLHAFKNAVIPTLTVIGTSVGYMLGGSFVVETIFRVPGIGYMSIEAISRRDYPVIQGTTLLLATIFVLVNLIVDIMYGAIDPRIRYAAVESKS
jgi:ABC-type dipeptide/oligopeptide/nickel transport system permease component